MNVKVHKVGDTRGAARKNQEQAGAARSDQGQPGAARRSQKRNPGKGAQEPPKDPWEVGGSKKAFLIRNLI